jgi:hypothetical protein
MATLTAAGSRLHTISESLGDSARAGLSEDLVRVSDLSGLLPRLRRLLRP